MLIDIPKNCEGSPCGECHLQPGEVCDICGRRNFGEPEVKQMRRVVLESPYAGNIIERWLNRRYARRCVRDSLSRGEAPIASHLLYTQPGILRDSDPIERQWGIDAGLAWRSVAEATVVYIDRGVSPGMTYGITRAKTSGLPVEVRSLRPAEQEKMEWRRDV